MTELESLRAECERLQRLLDEHGIDWRPKPIRSVMSLMRDMHAVYYDFGLHCKEVPKWSDEIDAIVNGTKEEVF